MTDYKPDDLDQKTANILGDLTGVIRRHPHATKAQIAYMMVQTGAGLLSAEIGIDKAAAELRELADDLHPILAPVLKKE